MSERGSYPFLCRDSMESLIHQHSYSRSPLRSYTDAELEESLKQHREYIAKGIIIYLSNIVLLLLFICIQPLIQDKLIQKRQICLKLKYVFNRKNMTNINIL